MIHKECFFLELCTENSTLFLELKWYCVTFVEKKQCILALANEKLKKTKCTLAKFNTIFR